MSHCSRLCCSIILLLVSPNGLAEQPLHKLIDQHVKAKTGDSTLEQASDSEFLRRVYLDLAGRIPSPTEARAFLEDASESKRTHLVDKILAGSDYPQRMKELFHVMLMERRGTHPEWDKFLTEAFEDNRGWNHIAARILNPNADDEETRGAAFFITKRLEKYGQNPTDYPGLVRDVGRLFVGVDVQCAQCHDHLFVDDYKQVDFQGLFAFFTNVSIRRGVSYPAIVEKPFNKKIEFSSVFELEPKTVGPRIPFGKESDIPIAKKGEEYSTPPDKKKPGILKHSPLKLLGESLPTATNELFTRNIVNRLWNAMMGRGLVHPLDLHHSDNPPSHPELLDEMARQFTSHEFDIKWFIRQLALSNTYQRSSQLPEKTSTPGDNYAVAIEKPLSAEQLLRSVLVATEELSRFVGDNTATDQDDAETSKDSDDAGKATSYDDVYQEFKTALANPPAQPEGEFAPSVKAALFLSNAKLLVEWLKPRDGNLTHRLLQVALNEDVVTELYIAILSRYPSDEERQETVQYFERRADDRLQAIKNVAWAMISSTEFSLNH